MLSAPRTFRIAFFVAACLFAAGAARADSVAFESVVSPGGAQSGAQNGGQTSKSSQSGQGGGQNGGGGQPAQVLTVDLGDVTGTVCDCGEIAPAGAPGASPSGDGFPRLPLLAFAAAPGIPCLFTDLCSREPPPPPPPPPPGVPEPLTLITFATGLGAFAALRRRRHR